MCKLTSRGDEVRTFAGPQLGETGEKGDREE
jgi:hypothetical protein